MVVVEQAARDHRFRAAYDLFGWLKHEQVAAAHIPDAIDQRARNADHDSHVRVMPACVHATVLVRRKLDARLLVNRQGVDVCTKHHGLAGLASIQERDHTCLGGAALQL